MDPPTDQDRPEPLLEEEAAVGSIHHILKIAFKELYGVAPSSADGPAGGAEKEATALGNQPPGAEAAVGGGPESPGGGVQDVDLAEERAEESGIDEVGAAKNRCVIWLA